MNETKTQECLTLESNLNQLLQELHNLATRVKTSDQSMHRKDGTNDQGQFLIANGRA